MSVREVYQTLRFLNNNERVLQEGPYKCLRSDAWLGHGYYFWEDSLRPAKYWGKRMHDNKYIIGKGRCEINEENCFYLVGSVKHNEFFVEALNQISEIGELSSNVTVPHVIDYLKKTGQFPFYACRAETTEAFAPSKYWTEDDFTNEVLFKQGQDSRVKLNLIIQLCIYELDKINFEWLEICYEHPRND
ncbi:MAG: hypothetical protein ACTJHT_06765 [Sphingobacterium sp.]